MTSTPAPLRTVHVGARGRGAWPLQLMAADDRFEPVAIVTRDPATAAEVLAPVRLSPGAVFTDLASALAAVECDVVVVCTPVELHARDLPTAFAAGKDVLVEKCLSNNWTEACALAVGAEAAGVELVVAQNYRYTAATMTLQAASRPASTAPRASSTSRCTSTVPRRANRTIPSPCSGTRAATTPTICSSVSARSCRRVRARSRHRGRATGTTPRSRRCSRSNPA